MSEIPAKTKKKQQLISLNFGTTCKSNLMWRCHQTPRLYCTTFSAVRPAGWEISTACFLFLSACKTLLNKKSDGVKVSCRTHGGFIDSTVCFLLLSPSWSVTLITLFPHVSLILWYYTLCSPIWITSVFWCSVISFSKVLKSWMRDFCGLGKIIDF